MTTDIEAVIDEARQRREDDHRRRQERRAADRETHQQARALGLAQRQARRLHDLRRGAA